MGRQTGWGAYSSGRCALEMPIAADQGTPGASTGTRRAIPVASHSKAAVVVKAPSGGSCAMIWSSHIHQMAG